MMFTCALSSRTSRANLCFNCPAKSVPLHFEAPVNISTSCCNATHTSTGHMRFGLPTQLSPAALL